MMKLINRLLIILLCAGALSSCKPQNQLKLLSVSPKAPFEMPAIQYPDFRQCPNFNIKDYGAVPNDQKKTTLAIARAIDAASKANGGNVIIPAGRWQTGAIHFKSNVNLHLNKRAVLLFSDNPEDYLPAVHTTWEGLECYNYSPLIYAYQCKNIAITGPGELEAKMEFWKQWFGRPSGHLNSLKRLYNMVAKNVPVEQRQMVNDSADMRPHFIQFNRSENILMDSVTVRNSPFWTLHPYLCKNVVFRHLNVRAHGHNNDGVDPEMTQNMLIEDCVFDQGDDAIAVKSGRNQDAWRLNTPTKNLVIRRCVVKNGHQLLAVGSELSGGIENVYMDSCTVADGAAMYHLVFIKTNERRGGYVRNIYVQNIKADKMREGVLGIETDVLYQWRYLVPTYEKRLTPISDIYLKNIHANDVGFVLRILSQKELPVDSVKMENIQVDSIRKGPETIIKNAKAIFYNGKDVSDIHD